MRFEDASAVIREAFPAEYADLVLVVTELGGTTVPMALLATLFWLASRHRRRTALVISYAVAGLAFLLAVKAVLAMPRPPEDAFLTAVGSEADGYGFPSGHAFAATVVYGGLLTAFDRMREPRALVGVGTVVGLVALSRVVLGVHYLGDVIVGVALGVVFLVTMNRLTRGDPTRGFAVALLIAVPAVAVTGASEDALLALGGAIGGLLVTARLDDYTVPALGSRLEGGVLVAVGGGVVVAIRIAESAVTIAPVLVALYALLVAWVFLAPIVVGQVSADFFGTASARA